MRGISFRGKRIEYGEWVHGYLIGDDVIVGNIVEFNDEYFNTSFWYKVRPETVGQYTGLQDRNGIEAYEGDIIKAGNSIGVIFYNLDSFNIEWKVDRDFWNEHPRYHVPNGEVIGNIYESPHLLDKAI